MYQGNQLKDNLDTFFLYQSNILDKIVNQLNNSISQCATDSE